MKTSNFAFDMDGKENFVARLKQLIGNRSARAAATEWGLSFSTLHNYLTRGTEPSYTVVQSITYKEHVSLDWLAFSLLCTQKEVASTSEILSINEESLIEDPLEATWHMIYKSLNKKDLEALIMPAFARRAKGVLALSGRKDDLDSLLLQLPKEEKERLIALHEAKKEAVSEECAVADVASLNCKKSGAA
ncbi:MAG: hypothetical protein ACR5LG_06030 [Sodalis sp. (in: enterobacteria)]